METWSRSLFDLVLMSSQDRLFERAVARFEGEDAALARLKSPDESVAQLVSDFVDALFNDFGIVDSAGACFVLQGLQRQRVTIANYDGSIEGLLVKVAKDAFSALLVRKTVETAELSMSYDFRAPQF